VTDAENNLYVADWGNDRIQKFTADGTFITKWGSHGNGQFIRPSGLSMDAEGCLYVSEFDNNRIQKFSDNGTFLDTWGTTGSADGELQARAPLC